MLIVLVVVIVAWILASESNTEKIVVSLSVGLVISYIVAVMASFPPIMTIPLGGNEALRVFSPVAYPFSILQYRDYDANLFSYSVNIGWPEGLPVLSSGLMPDQSEYIHLAHYTSGLFLGLLLLLLVTIFVGFLTLVERKRAVTRPQGPSSAKLLVVLQLILLFLMLNFYLLGSIVYLLGGVVVLIITLYPALRFGMNRKS